MCGSLQCQFGHQTPLIKVTNQEFTRTMVYTNGKEYECKVFGGSVRDDIVNMGMIQDGTKCAEDKVRTKDFIYYYFLPDWQFPQICMNQTCVSVELFIDSLAIAKCPVNTLGDTCSGHGVSWYKRLTLQSAS